MTYFSQEYIDFFQELEKNNTKEWFDEHRKSYEKEVKKPFAAFAQLMIDRISEHEPETAITPSDAIFRINKDIRFSKDKTPYKTHMAANISKFGRKDKSYPGFYYQIGADGIEVFGGAYMPDKEQLQSIRNRIMEQPMEFEKAVGSTEFKKYYGTLQGEVNKRLDPETKEAAKKQPLLANKQFWYSAKLPASLITDSRLPDVLMEYYLAARPVHTFFIKSLSEH